jgi:diadenosine tetraphosphate (Ap4A) HIT family hydrolase
MENEHALAFRDGYPVAQGHTLVIPRVHVASLFDLGPQVKEAVWGLVAQVRDQLADTLHPDAFTIGVNDCVAAGQTVPHAHIHVIPRWNGDVPDPRGGVRRVFPRQGCVLGEAVKPPTSDEQIAFLEKEWWGLMGP